MNKTTFENEYFKCRRDSEGNYLVIILEDKNKFYDIDLTGCVLRTTKEGFVADRWTTEVLNIVDGKFDNSDINEKFKNANLFLNELRNRTLNTLMAYL